MNAAIRSVVRTAHMGIECLGVRRGIQRPHHRGHHPHGLCPDQRPHRHTAEPPSSPPGARSSARRSRRKAAATCKLFGLDGIVGIGGDGTYRGLMEFCNQEGVAVVGMPGTIDNDIAVYRLYHRLRHSLQHRPGLHR